jgi:Flp pilus assembly protein TadB
MTRAILSSRRAMSRLAIWMISLGSALFVLGLALFLQWFIYTDWMHRNGQLRIVGAVLAALLTWFVVLRWQQAARRRQLELIQRLETIRWMNDRIRNALQSIDLLAFAHSEAAEQVRGSVDTISAVLHEVQKTTGSSHSPTPTAGKKTARAVAVRQEAPSHEAQSSVSQKSARN